MHDFTIPEYSVWPVADLVLPESLPACIRDQVSPEEVASSTRYGQIQPVLAAESAHGRLQVLSGFSTFLVLKKAGFSRIACRILPQAMPPAPAFALRILHERKDCEKSPVLQAWLLKEAQAQLSIQDILSLLPLMGLKPQPHVIEERIRLLLLDDALLAALHHQELQIKNLVPLLRLPQEEQQGLLELIRRYRLGGSKQQKLVEIAVDLHLREGRKLADILAEWRQSDPPRDNLPQESQSLLSFLHVLANPRSAQAEAQFAEHLRHLQPPAQVNVAHTPAFEDEELKVQLSYSGWNALQAQWPQILKALETGNQDP